MVLHGLSYGFEGTGFGDDFPSVAFVVEIFTAGFEDDVHQLLFVGRGFGNGDDALLRKHEADGVGLAEVAATLCEGVANFADRAVAVVGGAVHDDGNAAGPVAFEGDFFVGGAGELTGAALDGALDVVVGHVLGLGGSDGAAQARIAVGITARLGGDADFLDELRENLAALGVERTLFVLDCRPFGMAGHGNLRDVLSSEFWGKKAEKRAISGSARNG